MAFTIARVEEALQKTSDEEDEEREREEMEGLLF
jgi:hypothetical protein